jgi:hypothetical protein
MCLIWISQAQNSATKHEHVVQLSFVDFTTFSGGWGCSGILNYMTGRYSTLTSATSFCMKGTIPAMWWKISTCSSSTPCIVKASSYCFSSIVPIYNTNRWESIPCIQQLGREGVMDNTMPPSLLGESCCKKKKSSQPTPSIMMWFDTKWNLIYNTKWRHCKVPNLFFNKHHHYIYFKMLSHEWQ